MKNFHSIFAAMAIFSVASIAPSCTGIETDRRSDGPVTVAFTTAQSDTRAELDPSAGRFTWEIGDKVAVWADNQTGSAVLEAKEFTLLSRANHTKGYFTSTLDAPMAEDTYNYYIAFPVPASYSGKNAVFTLPSEQNGKASGACIAISGPVEAGALREFDATRPADETVSLSMNLRHLLHYLRFCIPAGENAMNEPVSLLEFSMPQAIAGTVNVNVEDGSASLTDARTAITITPDNPVPDGEFISSSIFPPQRTYVNDEFLNVRVYSENWYSDIEPIRLEGRDFQAGHITTVPLRAKTVSPVYNLTFTLISNNLGQEVKNLTFTFDNEVTWGGERWTSFSYADPDGSTIIPGERIVLKTLDESEFRALSGTGFTASYESADAIVSERITFPDMSTGNSVNVGLNCPYLMFEDFSCIQSSFNSGDKHSASNTGNKSPYYIESGWSVARAGGEAGTAIRLAAHREAVACYHSRCDSPLLSGIKEGHTVNISLTFNYSMNRQEGGIGSKPKLGATVNVGWTTDTGNLSSGNETGTFPDSFYVNEETGSYSEIGNEHSTQLDGITNAMRLSIRELAETKADMTNGTYWLYLDNIKVSIANN
ncbi:MAG: hypothetical protein SPI33_02870 [Candidatus Cryptobacteroides sp.]|nr:hypothetical protein [Bacteroidales bacterium]MDY5496124.1 hypothetical protein [Candidatus Cryptobacteroides sp.]MDY6182434.1 hypothetical protein [Candidatus Cryptobacteroides sp.]